MVTVNSPLTMIAWRRFEKPVKACASQRSDQLLSLDRPERRHQATFRLPLAF
jgi:hypothetical protein